MQKKLRISYKRTVYPWGLT